MTDERQSDLIMVSALAKALTEVVERLDREICEPALVDELTAVAERAESELEEAA